MRAGKIATLAFTILLLTGASTAAAVSFVGVGDLPGGVFFSLPTGVSADGSTVVGNSRTASGEAAFRWTANEGITGLGVLPNGQVESNASAVSADGSTIVGRSFGTNASEGFRWSATDGVQGLGQHPGGGLSNSARAISADGSTITGVSQIPVNASSGEAFRWNAVEGLQRLSELPVATTPSITGTGVSADGSTIVGFGRNNSGLVEAFRWDSTTGVQGLNGLSTGSFDIRLAKAVSADGSVIVGQGSMPGIVGNQAFRWDAINGAMALGDLPGGAFFSDAKAVSADGKIVVGRGSINRAFSDSQSAAFIWDETNGMQDLEVLLISLGLDLSGWSLREASGISADGRTIVGFGTNPDGFSEGFVAVIPEPSVGLLVGMGLLGLGSRKSRVTDRD